MKKNSFFFFITANVGKYKGGRGQKWCENQNQKWGSGGGEKKKFKLGWGEKPCLESYFLLLFHDPTVNDPVVYMTLLLVIFPSMTLLFMTMPYGVYETVGYHSCSYLGDVSLANILFW